MKYRLHMITAAIYFILFSLNAFASKAANETFRFTGGSSEQSLIPLTIEVKSVLPQYLPHQILLLLVVTVLGIYAFSQLLGSPKHSPQHIPQAVNQPTNPKPAVKRLPKKPTHQLKPQLLKLNATIGKVEAFRVNKNGTLTISGWANSINANGKAHLKIFIGGDKNSTKATGYFTSTEEFRIEFNKRNGFSFNFKILAEWVQNKKMPVYVYVVNAKNQLVLLENCPKFFQMNVASKSSKAEDDVA